MEIIQDYVYIAQGRFEEFQKIIQAKNFTKVAVLVDEQTKLHCYPKIQAFLPTHKLIEIPSGEQHKNIDTCTFIWEKMTEYSLDRKSLMINLGGGVIGDMGGFCAATYKRGMAFIQIPTTLLAQVDASVGGKLGIDFQGFKNHIGVFKEPEMVWIDTNFLDTLPDEELRSGFAEIVKHCLIADVKQWKTLVEDIQNESDFDTKIKNNPEYIAGLVSHSVKVKATIVEADPLEKGQRKLLNFGHTLGHALETFLLFDQQRKLLHGEAVAAGMICENYIAQKRGILNETEGYEVLKFIQMLYPKGNFDLAEIQDIVKLTSQDKKNQGGKIMMTLLEGIGNGIFNQEAKQDEMEESLGFYQKMII